MLHYVQTLHLSCTKTNTVSKQTKARFHDTRHLGVPSCASRLISKHMLRSIQTMHLCCIRISTISKLTEPSFHLSLFNQEYKIVRPNWFLSLWCIMRKLCTYPALKLIMSTNGPKQDSIWHTSSRSSNMCVQIDFQGYGMFHANRAPILHQD